MQPKNLAVALAAASNHQNDIGETALGADDAYGLVNQLFAGLGYAGAVCNMLAEMAAVDVAESQKEVSCDWLQGIAQTLSTNRMTQ